MDNLGHLAIKTEGGAEKLEALEIETVEDAFLAFIQIMQSSGGYGRKFEALARDRIKRVLGLAIGRTESIPSNRRERLILSIFDKS